MIPKVIHTIWVGGPMPDHLAAYVDTWRQVHPDWEFRHWDEQALATLDDPHDLIRDAERYTPHVGQFRADVARYQILHRHGGVYVDCDFEARQNIEPLLDITAAAGASAFAAWEVDAVWVNNAILGAVPGSTFMARLIDGLYGSIITHTGARPNVMTGPQYLTPIYRQDPDDVWVFPSSMFYPYAWNELDRQDEPFPDAWAVHHWDNARKRLAARRG